MESIAVTVPLVLGFALIAASMDSKLKRLDHRFARVERQLDLITAHLGVPSELDAELSAVDALLRQGKSIAAIKAYREITGAGLKEAKEAVDQRAGRA
ncbi:ribosomal protein L7/L12 [Streptomyces sp. NBC_00344]|uniref:ribosomal protein L7/L12 n=1 Tax=Streptomyces sp. NBC_00344 TaxID=2975720 RepID=UPI002E231CDF